MKSIFDTATIDELIHRINSISLDRKSLWGKMNLYQMLKHCTSWDEMILGKRQVKRMFLGRLFGKLALKSVLKNADPLGKNSPTSSELIITVKDGDVTFQKNEWINTIKQYQAFTNVDFIHPFFGTMTKEQIGWFVYKHADHHLRQFGA